MSQPVFPPKSSDLTDICLCVDMMSANKTILRTGHITPTIEEIVSEVFKAGLTPRLSSAATGQRLAVYHYFDHTHWTVALQTLQLWCMLCVRDLPERNSGDFGSIPGVFQEY